MCGGGGISLTRRSHTHLLLLDDVLGDSAAVPLMPDLLARHAVRQLALAAGRLASHAGGRWCWLHPQQLLVPPGDEELDKVDSLVKKEGGND